MSSTRCQFLKHNRSIVSWKRFPKAQRSRYCPCRDEFLRLFAERINFLSIIQVLQEKKLLVRVILELLNQLFGCFSAIRVLLFDCRMKYVWFSAVDVAAAILSSERAFNCTNTLCFDEVSKYFCMVRSLVCPERVELLPCFVIVHRIHCSEKHGLLVPFETFSSWDQSTSDY